KKLSGYHFSTLKSDCDFIVKRDSLVKIDLGIHVNDFIVNKAKQKCKAESHHLQMRLFITILPENETLPEHLKMRRTLEWVWHHVSSMRYHNHLIFSVTRSLNLFPSVNLRFYPCPMAPCGYPVLPLSLTS
ncbi:hypothetical protein U0070_004684, partial [Myodes glareolus]